MRATRSSHPPVVRRLGSGHRGEEPHCFPRASLAAMVPVTVSDCSPVPGRPDRNPVHSNRRRQGPGSRAATFLLLLLAAGCGDGAPPEGGPGEDAPGDSAPPTAATTLYFVRGDAPAPVQRTVAGEPGPETTLRALLQGPTAQEREAGITSWFSDATADRLHSLSLAEGGRLVVDFNNLQEVIPNASSSTGSTFLLLELNSTLFQHPEVEVIEYRMEGSCQAFWGWLQYECQDVRRP
jgi:hypothetical protein